MTENNSGDRKDEDAAALVDPRDEKTIFVNKKKILIKENYMTGKEILERAEKSGEGGTALEGNYLTGKEILERADFDPDLYDLFLVHGQKSEQVKPEQKVHIEDDLHFNAIRRDVPYG